MAPATTRFRIGTRKSTMALAQTEEIARRLVAIHYPLAEHLDGGADLQRQTRKRVEELMN